MASIGNVHFVGMTQIKKMPNRFRQDHKCTDWIATEKVHGSSFQFATSNGDDVTMSSRRRVLDPSGSFLKCDLQPFLKTYIANIKNTWDILHTQDRWAEYVKPVGKDEKFDDEEDEEEDGAQNDDVGDEEGAVATEEDSGDVDEDKDKSSGPEPTQLRIYGELYGGGGVNKDLGAVVQKEILYSDDFRFYVFGITVNQRWMTVGEMNEICREAGFPYYAVPMCEPKATLDDLIEWIHENNFLGTRSRMTDRTDDHKSFLEGVVMSPLTRPDFRMHPIKLLAEAFTDVKLGGAKKQYCTKARYNSVMSKLDIDERKDTPFVTEMFINDILEERGPELASKKERKTWTTALRTWLEQDGYYTELNPHILAARQAKLERDAENEKKREEAAARQGEQEGDRADDEEEEEEEGGLGGLFS